MKKKNQKANRSLKQWHFLGPAKRYFSYLVASEKGYEVRKINWLAIFATIIYPPRLLSFIIDCLDGILNWASHRDCGFDVQVVQKPFGKFLRWICFPFKLLLDVVKNILNIFNPWLFMVKPFLDIVKMCQKNKMHIGKAFLLGFLQLTKIAFATLAIAYVFGAPFAGFLTPVFSTLGSGMDWMNVGGWMTAMTNGIISGFEGFANAVGGVIPGASTVSIPAVNDAAVTATLGAATAATLAATVIEGLPQLVQAGMKRENRFDGFTFDLTNVDEFSNDSTATLVKAPREPEVPLTPRRDLTGVAVVGRGPEDRRPLLSPARRRRLAQASHVPPAQPSRIDADADSPTASVQAGQHAAHRTSPDLASSSDSNPSSRESSPSGSPLLGQ